MSSRLRISMLGQVRLEIRQVDRGEQREYPSYTRTLERYPYWHVVALVRRLLWEVHGFPFGCSYEWAKRFIGESGENKNFFILKCIQVIVADMGDAWCYTQGLRGIVWELRSVLTMCEGEDWYPWESIDYCD